MVVLTVVPRQWHFILRVCGALLLWVMAGFASAADSATGEHIRVQLVSEWDGVAPGRTHWVGVILEPDPHWHTYWRNPGDSGEPPTLTWRLPPTIQAGDIQWPLPDEIPVAHLTNYGYSGAHLLMVPLQVGELSQSNADISVDISWLVCREDCIPGWATLSMNLPVEAEPSPSEHHPLFEQTRLNLPAQEIISARYEVTDSHLVLAFTAPKAGPWRALPLEGNVVVHGASQQLIRDGDVTRLLTPRSEYLSAKGQPIAFLLTNGEQGYYLHSEYNAGASVKETSQGGIESLSLWLLMLMAFAGGLILNLMPCVLPVLSIKALGLRQGHHTLMHKLAYAFGVWGSFMAFAAIIVALKSAGSEVGWGFHMQNPIVIGLLSFLFLFIALNLMDLAPVGGRLAGMGQSLTQGDSAQSQFFTGVLAVLVASPCTAPFMAAAIGVALVSDALMVFIIFTALALGFALPLSLIYFIPALQRRLPRPGPWMNTFRQFLAFPMLATVLWLAWIYQQQTSAYAHLWLMIALLGLGFWAWSRQHLARLPSWLVAVATLAVMSQPLRLAQTSQDASPPQAAQAFSEHKLATLRARGAVVVVNMTADWCITCKVNEQVAFSSGQVQTLLESENVHYLVGDWTNRNDEIFGYLQRYGRAGVPLYVVYAGMADGQVLPQLLTPELLIRGIEQAKEEIRYESQAVVTGTLGVNAGGQCMDAGGAENRRSGARFQRY
ncbi:Thiol:disulfide interchange protein [Hahella chejuensis KCTC 2396]|uniref:Thiol:disulfide interchange protein n=1 Tax=Hahella chejuensis (strain KCTC 2396) TaxID=349521 RepID=Q2SGD5_HAHCH|nr:protein-disulfide reductase DsbD domain-containing protein [Hahella chejuensis]ABC30289.1 Thiol:disulfide interchange protein [Hahella chejuensis KCTC 2396]